MRLVAVEPEQRSVGEAVATEDAAARDWRGHLWIWFLGLNLVLAALYFFSPPLTGNGPLINAIGLLSPVAIVVGIVVHRPKAASAWWLFALGMFLYFLGDVYTYSYPKLAGVEVPFPSLGDAAYLVVYPALMAGLLILVRRRNPVRDRAALIDSTILTIGIGLLSWVFLVAPNIHLSGLSWFAKGVSAAYPVGDILLLAAAIRLAVDAGKRAPSFYMLIASIVSLLAVDSAYGYALLVEGYNGQLGFDAGWIAYQVLWGLAALHPSMRTLEQPSTVSRARLTKSRLIVLGAACLIAPVILFQAFTDPDVLVLIAASAALFLLVVGRMAGLVRQEEHAAARESALRRAGVDLVAAAGHEQVYAAAVGAASALLGGSPDVRLVMGDAEAAVAASSKDEGEWSLPRAARGWLQGAIDGTLRVPLEEVPSAVRRELRLRDGETVLVLPLSVRDEVRGRLVLCATRISPEQLDSLEALATQISLRVESASLARDLHRRQSEARFRSLVAHSSDLISVLDAHGVVTYQSPSVERVLGYSVEDIEGSRFDRLVGAADQPRLTQVIRGDSGSSGDAHTIECTLRHRDGRLLHFEVQHTDLLDDEHVCGIVLNSRDVSERKAFEDQLAHQAFHDPVTNLANRALFTDRVQNALARAERNDTTVGVLFIDLDEFKMVNDSLGHPAGDVVLREVGQRLVEAVRPSDTVARFGGDEFAVLLDGIEDSPEAADAAARILRTLEQKLEVDGKEVFPRSSIGICLARPESGITEADELLRNADVAMYMAKRDSKGSYRIFEPEMHEGVLERLELRSDLQKAMESDQLAVHYQPVVRLDEHDIYGVEALLRWTHPTKGNIQPDQFIPIAEETGLIIPIGRWVLNVACHDGALINERRKRPEPLAISVNLSVKQLQSESIVADVQKALETSGLAPSSLVLEITESVMLADTDLAVRRLMELKDLGVRLAMDDFGTGYSSLSYLGRFPVDILKMDRSFLASRQNDTLATAIIALGENLTLEVVAEGIEHPEQALWLQDVGCELGQGFHFARPMSDAALVEYLEEGDENGWNQLGSQPESDAA